jgi:triphosphatase
MLEASSNQEGCRIRQAFVASVPQAHREIELKLLAAPSELALVRNAPIIHQRARNKGVTRRLETIYYDTSDRLLFRHGLSLRVRQIGNHYVQTLKSVPDTDPLLRREWEAPVDSRCPDLARLPKAEIGTPLDVLTEKTLAPIFTTKVHRHQQILDLPDAVVEVAFDEGTIEAGGRSEWLSEIELELKSGDASELYDLGLLLLDIAPLRVGTSAKSQRGYALAFELPPRAVKAKRINLSTEDDVDAAIAKFLRNCQHQLMGNLAAAETGGTEGVHQMRVALRRLRAALSIVRHDVPAPSLGAADAEARRLARILGSARGWDVFVTETLPNVDAAHLPGLNLDALRSAAKPLRAKSHAAVRDALADPRTNRFLLSFGRLVARHSWRDGIGEEALALTAEPVTALAERALARIGRKALARGRQFRQMTPAARHRLRLALKKLRYATEFFLPLYAEQASARDYLKHLSALQDALGADNDMTMTRVLLDDIARGTVAPDAHRAIAAIIQWQSHARHEAAKALCEEWHGFKQSTPFWPH